MRAQRVVRPIRSIEEVQASLETFGGKVADLLDARRAGGAGFSYRQVFDDFAYDLESLRRDVVGAEDAHVRRQVRASGLRRECEELGTELYEQQVAVRRILGGAYGPERGFELAAVSGVTPRTLKPLEEQVDQTVKLLRAPRVEEPAVRVAGVTIDLDKVADGLEKALQDFRAVRAALDRARKAVGESKVLLDRALAGFQAGFPWIARALESHFRRVGEGELAERIRTSLRRVTRRQAEDEEAPEQAALGETSAGSLQEIASSEATVSSEETPPSVATVPATSSSPAALWIVPPASEPEPEEPLPAARAVAGDRPGSTC